MKKLLASVLALTMVFGMCACANPNGGTKTDDQNPEGDDGLVTVYQRMLATEYMEDGTRGHSQKRYTYDDRGNLLAIETDYGPDEVVWLEEYQIEQIIFKPYDGTIDDSEYYVYTDDGCIKYSDRYDGPVIENGALMEKMYRAGDLYYQDLYYTFLSDGRIATMEWYRSTSDGPAYDEPTTSYKCSYNDNKQLTSVVYTVPDYGTTDAYRRVGDWLYDDQGRMIEERYYSYSEATRCYRYTYNDQGLLATVEYCRLNMDVYGNYTDTEMVIDSSTDIFIYDDEGRLINSDGTVIQYDKQGRVVAYGDATVTYLGNGGKKVVDENQEFEFDQHGNLIRHSFGGGYTEYEYKAIRVTKAEAKRLAYFELQRRIRDSRGSREYTREYMCMADYPQIPLIEYELLLNRYAY